MFKNGLLFFIASSFIALPSIHARESKHPEICYKHPGSTDCYKAREKNYRKKHGVLDASCSKHPGLKGCNLPSNSNKRKRAKTKNSRFYSYEANTNPYCNKELILRQRDYSIHSAGAGIDNKLKECVSKIKHSDMSYLYLARKYKKLSVKNQLEKQIHNELMRCLEKKRYNCNSSNIFTSMNDIKSCKRSSSKRLTTALKKGIVLSLQDNCEKIKVEDNGLFGWKKLFSDK